MPEYKGVLICGELFDGSLASITLELLGIGRKLADDLGQDLSIVFIGSEIGDVAKQVIPYGADKVYLIDNPLFKDYQTDSHTRALHSLCKQVMPEIVLLGHTSVGRDLAPSLAYTLDTGVTLDCISLCIDQDTKLMRQIKPVYGGNALATYVCEETHPQIATVRAKVMSPLERDNTRSGEVIPFDPGLDASLLRARVLGKIKDEVVGIKLEDARVVVCGGKGIGSTEGFSLLKELAKILGGAVGATRLACDAGWVSTYCQIGLTGKIIAPDVYIGIALSGTSQHQMGMSASKNIIAINKDPEAEIFKLAHYGVVGDYKKVLPPFVEKCKEFISSEP